MAYSIDYYDEQVYKFPYIDNVEKIIKLITSKFGEPTGFPILKGIVYVDDKDAPHVFYPDKGGIVIHLSRSAENDEWRTHYQLFHELLHFTTPNGPGCDKTLCLEEGIATYCSLLGMVNFFHDNHEYINWTAENCMNKEKLYGKVFLAIKPILQKYPYCIKNIRDKKLNEGLDTHISSITKEELLSETKGEFTEEIKFLMQKFYKI